MKKQCLNQLYCIVGALLLIAFNCMPLQAHVGLWDKAIGEFKAGQSFNGYLALDLKISDYRNLYVTDLGLDDFDIGNDSIAFLGLSIYDSGSEECLLKVDTSIRDVYNKQVFLKFSFLFLKGKKYRLLLNSSGPNMDNKATFYEPVSLPFAEPNNFFNLQEAFFSLNQAGPWESSKQIPVLNFGVENQTGINLFSQQQAKAYLQNAKDLLHLTAISTNKTGKSFVIDTLEVHYFDVGPDEKSQVQVSILDLDKNICLAKKDTLIQGVHRTVFKLPIHACFQPGMSYFIEFRNIGHHSNDDAVYLFKPEKIPYIDNFNVISVDQFYRVYEDSSTVFKDSLGINYAFDFNYTDSFSTDLLNNKSHVNSGLRIYPNPAKEYFFIDLAAFNCFSDCNFKVELLDFTGVQKDLKVDFFQNKAFVSLENHQSGIYFLKITFNNIQYFDKLVFAK